MTKELYTRECILTKLKELYNDRFCIVTTNDLINKAKWADRVVKEIYDTNRRKMSEFAYHFSYIKFAQNAKNEVYGIEGGKSQFHWKYPSDVTFYDVYKIRKSASKFMIEHELDWYKQDILILKNIDSLNRKEAFDNEANLQNTFQLFQ